MGKTIKQYFKRTPLYGPVRALLGRLTRARQLRQWEARGRPAPPPAIVKHEMIRGYARQYSLKTFVETGTYYGDTVDAVRSSFGNVYSIELSPELHARARRRFRSDPRVHLIQGDSGEQIGGLMHQLRQPSLFWLDGHYSGGETARGENDTPIYKELSHILRAPDLGHVILIDDAHCFGKDPGYPTLDELTDFVISLRSNLSLEVRDDCIRILPRRPVQNAS